MEPPRTLVVFTTQRSGSNFLGSLLLQSWTYGWLGEWLNPPFEMEERERQKIPGTANLLQYLDAVSQARRTPEKGWAIKLMPDHWRRTVDRFRSEIREGADAAEIFHECFFRPVPVYLKRKDTLAQAVSLTLAAQTDQWRVFQGEDPDAAPPPTFDREAIQQNLDRLIAENTYWETTFQTLGLSPLRIDYEALTALPTKTLQSILESGSYPFDPAELPAASQTRKQASTLNEEWIERFKAASAD